MVRSEVVFLAAVLLAAVATTRAWCDQIAPYPWLNMTSGEAAQIVRSYFGTVEPSPGVVAVAPTARMATPPVLYRFRAGNLDFQIGRTTSWFAWNTRYNAVEEEAKASASKQAASRVLTAAQAEAIARSYVNAHAEWSDHAVYRDCNECYEGYELDTVSSRFAEEQPNGFLGPADCSVGVDCATGRIVQWVDADYALTVTVDPQLTAAQAAQCAAQSIDLVPDGTPATLGPGLVLAPDSFGNEELVYEVRLCGYGDGDMQDDEAWDFLVDADTGAVTSVTTEMGLSSPPKITKAKLAAIKAALSRSVPHLPGRTLPMTVDGRAQQLALPILLIAGTPYVPLCYAADASGAIVDRSAGGRIAVRSGKLAVTLRLNELGALVGGKRVSAPAGIEAGNAAYIPLSLAQEIAPGRFVYDRDKRSLDYRPAAM